jgi:hypothetical protein
MNAENIAKALKCCYPPEGNNSCDGCPYDGMEDPSCIERNIEYRAGEMIESLLAQLDAAIAGQETLQKAFAESQRREKAAVADLKNATTNRPKTCRHYAECYQKCYEAIKIMPCVTCDKWQWRGPQKGEPHETV